MLIYKGSSHSEYMNTNAAIISIFHNSVSRAVHEYFYEFKHVIIVLHKNDLFGYFDS